MVVAMYEAIQATIRLRNYRCFADSNEGVLEIRAGFTAFVGANNSGKSTLLRVVRELKSVFSILGDPHALLAVSRGDRWGANYQDVEDYSEIFHDGNVGPVIVVVEMPTETLDELSKVRLTCERGTNLWTAKMYIGPNQVSPTIDEVRQHGLAFRNEGGGIQKIGTNNATRLAALLTGSVYIPAFRHAISGATGTTVGDLLLGTEFLNTWANWQTGTVKSQRQLVLHVVEDIRRMFGFAELSVQAAAGNTTLQVMVNRKDYRLREMGAGLTQFLLVLATVAIRQPGLVLIDEPELNLHPTLQQEFLTAIGSYSKYGVIFATHSLGLARSGAEHLYVVRREGDASVVEPWEGSTEIAETLRELNYSLYREGGQQQVLCVEGLTDVRPVQQLLRLLGHDHSTLVVHGGGDQICTDAGVEMIHELHRLARSVFVLLDSERTSENGAPKIGREWFKAECAKLGIPVHLTKLRAIENYFPDRAVKVAFGPEYRALGPFESRTDLHKKWKKGENWRAAREMTAEEWEGKDLKEFLSKLQ